MTLLPVDPGFAFDYLAILQVKHDNGLPVSCEMDRVESFIKMQHPNFERILASNEYHTLVCVNRSTFDAIELAHANKISARRVQQINYKRYLAKKALQSKFWPKAPVAEQKTSLTKRR